MNFIDYILDLIMERPLFRDNIGIAIILNNVFIHRCRVKYYNVYNLLGVCVFEDQTQGFLHARKVLYH